MERTRKSDVDVTADDDDGQSDTTNQLLAHLVNKKPATNVFQM